MRLLAPSLKGKLIGVILLSSVAASLITYAALLVFEFHTFQQDTRRNLGAMAGIIASNSSAALIYDDKPLAEENLAALRAEPAIAAAALYDQHGALYATYPANLGPAAVPAAPGAFGYTIARRQLRLFYPRTCRTLDRHPDARHEPHGRDALRDGAELLRARRAHQLAGHPPA